MSEQQIKNREVYFQQIKNYVQIIKEIGSGSQGKVFLGQIKNSDQKVAVKVVQGMNSREEKILDSIRENKPNYIIQVDAIEKIDNQVYILMELGGMNCQQFMKNQTFNGYDIEEKNRLFLQMVQGVQSLHNLGFFHRDLKPENFICCHDKEGQLIIKLVDFGKGKENKINHIQTQQAGTIQYMAPEMILTSDYDKTVDIWSLGVIWYEILNNNYLFDGTSERKVRNQITQCSQDQINQILEKIEVYGNFMKQMVCVDIQKRIQLNELLQQINTINLQKQQQKINQELEQQLNQQEFKELHLKHNQMKVEFEQEQKQIEIINNQFQQVASLADTIKQKLSYNEQLDQSTEKMISKDIIKQFQINQQEITLEMDSMKEKMNSIKDFLKDEEDSLRNKIHTLKFQIRLDLQEISYIVDNQIQDQQDDLYKQLQEKHQNIEQYQQKLNSMIQSQLSINQYNEILISYQEEMQSVKQLQEQVFEKKQRQQLIAQKQIDFLFIMQDKQNKFDESIEVLNDQILQIKNQKKKLSDFKDLVKKKFYEIQQKPKCLLESQQILDEIEEEFNKIYVELKKEEENFYKYTTGINNNIQQHQKINNDLQILIENFEKKSFEFIKFDLESFTFCQINQEQLLKEQNKLEQCSKSYQQNIKALNYFFSHIQENNNLNTKQITKLRDYFIFLNQDLQTTLQRITIYKQIIIFKDSINEESVIQEWKERKIRISKLNYELKELSNQLQEDIIHDEQKVNHLRDKLSQLEIKIGWEQNSIPSSDNMKSIRNMFEENQKSFFNLNLLLNFIKAFNFKRSLFTFKEFQDNPKSCSQEQGSNLQKNIQLELSESKIKVDSLYQKYLDIILNNQQTKLSQEQQDQDQQYLENQLIKRQNSLNKEKLLKLQAKVKNKKYIDELSCSFDQLDFNKISCLKGLFQQPVQNFEEDTY